MTTVVHIMKETIKYVVCPNCGEEVEVRGDVEEVECEKCGEDLLLEDEDLEFLEKDE